MANPYLAQIEDALAVVQPCAEAITTVLASAQGSWGAPAWTGGTSGRCEADLNGWSEGLPASGDDCVGALQELAAMQPDHISPDQAKQYRLAGEW